jgi:hypothetical protein
MDLGIDSITGARAINEAGQVLVSWPSSVIWEDGVKTHIRSDYYATMAHDINDRGEVAGAVALQNQQRSSFFLSNETYEVFGGWSEYQNGGSRTRLNNRGQVVGNLLLHVPSPGVYNPFVWENGQTTYLNDALPAGSGWSLLLATDVDDSGRIVGMGRLNGTLRAFLLTPVPEPSSLLALLCGLGGAIGIAHLTPRTRAHTNSRS